MQTSADVQEKIGKPQLLRLKALGSGVRVDKVLGNRVLIKAIQPFTDLDRVEKEGKLFIPKHVKEANTPLPSTGLVVAVGLGVTPDNTAMLEGAAVMFSKFAGSDFVVDEEDFKILDVPEILCILGFDDPIVPVTD